MTSRLHTSIVLFLVIIGYTGIAHTAYGYTDSANKTFQNSISKGFYQRDNYMGVSDGWAVTWGDEGYDRCVGVTVGLDDSVYVISKVDWAADMNPDPEIVEEHGGYGGEFVALSKFSPEGEYEWCVSWGGHAIAIDTGPDGNIFVLTQHYGGNNAIDLDPGPGEYILDSNRRLAYVSMFTPDGDFIRADMFGSSFGIDPIFLEIDSHGAAYVGGQYTGDILPGDPSTWETDFGVDAMYRKGFVLKFDEFGEVEWIHKWSGDMTSKVWDVAIPDDGGLYVSGAFFGTLDVDPGDGVLEFTSNGMDDIFLLRLDAHGNLIWAKTWGNNLYEQFRAIEVTSSGDLYAVGRYSGQLVFETANGQFTMVPSQGGYSTLMVRFDESGNAVWGKTWAWEGQDAIYRIIADDQDNILVLYEYVNCLQKFSPDNELVAETFYLYRPPDNIRCCGIACDSVGNIYIVGMAGGMVRFNPDRSRYVINNPDEEERVTESMFLTRLNPDGTWD